MTSRRARRWRHHAIITLAVAVVFAAHYLLPHDLKGWSPFFGFIANLLWIWSD